MDDVYIKKIILFFFYTFNNEDIALKAVKKTIDQCQKKILSMGISMDNLENEIEKTKFESILVYYLYKNWKKYIYGKFNEQTSLSHDDSWTVYEDTNLGLWRQFLKESKTEEYLVVLWLLVLKLKETSISEGLGVSRGTVRHRVNRGLRKIASLQVGG